MSSLTLKLLSAVILLVIIVHQMNCIRGTMNLLSYNVAHCFISDVYLTLPLLLHYCKLTQFKTFCNDEIKRGKKKIDIERNHRMKI